MNMQTDKTVVFTLPSEQKIEVEKALNYASQFLNGFLASHGESTAEIPLDQNNELGVQYSDVGLLNKFIKWLDTHLHDELREHSKEDYYWVQQLVSSFIRVINSFL
jgi:hypothetical protein